MGPRRKALLTQFGAELCLVSAAEGGFVGSIAMAAERARSRPGVFEPRQFANEHNVEAHVCTTGAELIEQLGRGFSPDAFVAGVGTGGSVMGIARALRSTYPEITCHPM